MFGAGLASQLWTQSFVSAGRDPPNIPLVVPEEHHLYLPTRTTLDLSHGVKAIVKDSKTGLWSNRTPGVHMDSSPMSESPPAPKFTMPAYGAVTMGHQTGEAGKAVQKAVQDTVNTVQDKWDHWSGNLSDLLRDVEWVWVGVMAVAGTYGLYRYTPILGILWEGLKALMIALRSSLKVLGWVWNGFEALMEELWSMVRRLFGGASSP